jgi:hypothetical protein
MIPRIPPYVSVIAAICALLVVPYYWLTGNTDWACTMIALAGLNVLCAWS